MGKNSCSDTLQKKIENGQWTDKGYWTSGKCKLGSERCNLYTHFLDSYRKSVGGREEEAKMLLAYDEK